MLNRDDVNTKKWVGAVLAVLGLGIVFGSSSGFSEEDILVRGIMLILGGIMLVVGIALYLGKRTTSLKPVGDSEP